MAHAVCSFILLYKIYLCIATEVSSDQSVKSRPLSAESQSVAKVRAEYQGDRTHDQDVYGSPGPMGDLEISKLIVKTYSY